MTGHAHDAEIDRWRPTVRMARTQSGSGTESAQAQADFMARVARGKSLEMTHKVLDWRAGKDKKLWRVNEIVTIENKYSYVQGDVLISGVTDKFGEDGATTELRLCGKHAFDPDSAAEAKPNAPQAAAAQPQAQPPPTTCGMQPQAAPPAGGR